MHRIEAKYKIFEGSRNIGAADDSMPKPGPRPLKHSIFDGGLFDIAGKPVATSSNKESGNGHAKYHIFDGDSIWAKREAPNPSTQLNKVAQAQRPPQLKHDIFGASTSSTHDIFGHENKKTPEVKNEQVKTAAHETAIAAAVVGGRSAMKGVGAVLNFFFPAPKARVEEPKIDPETVKRENEEALAFLTKQYGDVPLSDVGKLPETVIKRSQIAATAPPSKWLEIAEHHVQHARRSAKQIEAQNASIRAAQEKLQRLAARGPISTDHFMIDQEGTQSNKATNPIDAAYKGWRRRVFRALTARQLPSGQNDDVLDDSIILDVSNGTLMVINASKGGRPEPRPLSEIGKGYELKVRAPGATVGIDTKLQQWGQPTLNTSGWGRVVLEDRMGDRKGKIEVEVPMPSAEQFVKLVFEAKRTLAQAAMPLDRTMVAVPEIADLLPIPRADTTANATIFDQRTVTFNGAKPEVFFDSIAETQPLRPIRRKKTIIPNEKPNSADSSLDWLADQEAEREDLPF